MTRHVLMLCLLFATAAHADMTGQQRAQAAGRSLIGSPAPGLTLKTIDGETIDLGSLYGKKAVYLKFWATWCVPCRQQMPHFQHTFETAATDLVVIAIDVGFNDSVEEIRKYRRHLGITMPIVFDADGHLAAAFNLRVTPQHIVIGRDGRIRYIGHLADVALNAALAAARSQSTDRRASPVVARDSPVKHPEKRFDVGEKIPDTTVQTLDGHPLHLAKAGVEAPMVLVFLSPWCESYLATSRPQVSANCKAAREQISGLAGDGHTRWLGVASGLWATPQDLQKYRSDYQVMLPLTLDESGRLFREFGVRKTPTLVILDAQHTIVRRLDAGELASLPQVLKNL